MPKDPAFLFYPNDYSGGTLTMSFKEKGAYVDLMILQFNKGPFNESDAKKILRSEFIKLWPILQEKFVCEDGKYFNARLAKEIEKRKAHSLKQRENVLNRWNKSGTYDGNTDVIPLENRNRNNTEEGTGETNHLHDGIVPQMHSDFISIFPKYFSDKDKDFPALLWMAYAIGKPNGWNKATVTGEKKQDVRRRWGEIIEFVSSDKWYSTRSISDLKNEWQRLIQAFEKSDNKPVTTIHGTNHREEKAKRILEQVNGG